MLVGQGSIWIGGHTYHSNPQANGLIVAPYAASTKYNEPLLLIDGASDFTCLSRFTHQSEQYTFQAGLYIDRESLLSKSQADLFIRPALYLNNAPTPLLPIKKAVLRISTSNNEGVSSNQVLNDFKLADGRETVHVFTVPENLRRVTFQLDVEVRVSSTGGTQNLSSSVNYQLNSIDDTDRIDDLHLRHTAAGGYAVYLLGKSGEARPHNRVSFTFYHTHITSTLSSDLQTDENGKVRSRACAFV